MFFSLQSIKGVFEQLPRFLASATKEQPLVIILDALDQLSPLHGARRLTWLPRKLPPHVKFIVSTLPDQEYKCFPTLKVFYFALLKIINLKQRIKIKSSARFKYKFYVRCFNTDLLSINFVFVVFRLGLTVLCCNFRLFSVRIQSALFLYRTFRLKTSRLFCPTGSALTKGFFRGIN